VQVNPDHAQLLCRTPATNNAAVTALSTAQADMAMQTWIDYVVALRADVAVSDGTLGPWYSIHELCCMTSQQSIPRGVIKGCKDNACTTICSTL
jgi:hypothetical protein